MAYSFNPLLSLRGTVKIGKIKYDGRFQSSSEFKCREGDLNMSHFSIFQSSSEFKLRKIR